MQSAHETPKADSCTNLDENSRKMCVWAHTFVDVLVPVLARSTP